MPRNRNAKYRTAAERQAAYRNRLAVKSTAVEELIKALEGACDRGRCSKFIDNLPEDSEARMRELTRRLEGVRMIACRREDKEPIIELL